ncbi:MAG: hypothetical protein K6T88_18580, partial [Bacillus sp. (in: Bacteria)]|nr:hypothetical protein [Bacillus sp. (in: firmicutes)]
QENRPHASNHQRDSRSSVSSTGYPFDGTETYLDIQTTQNTEAKEPSPRFRYFFDRKETITSSDKQYHLTGYPFAGTEPYRDFKHQNRSWTTKYGSKRTVPTLPIIKGIAGQVYP